MNIEIIKEAILNRFNIEQERVMVFISPDKSSAIVLAYPMPKEGAMEIQECDWDNGGWPFEESCVPRYCYTQGGFQLYHKCFPGAFLDPRIVKIRAWDFIEENWRLC